MVLVAKVQALMYLVAPSRSGTVFFFVNREAKKASVE